MSGTGVVFDTSVLINILASGRAEQVLSALGGRRIVVAVTSRELIRDPLDPKGGGNPLERLAATGLVELLELPVRAQQRFIELTSAAPPDDLDDGEAAALAAGEHLSLSVAIDERKGRRVARARMPAVSLTSSAEVFADPSVGAALGADLPGAVFSALTHARMRVLPEHVQWVTSLIGPDRAAQCPSLRRRVVR